MDFRFERKLRKNGYRTIFGIDEVGVGPLAGAVTAAAVTAPAKFLISNFQFLNLQDSKKLTPQKREEFFKIFSRDPNFIWSLSSVYPKTIDRLNIYEARRLAAKRAVIRLEKKIGHVAEILVLDGNTKLRLNRDQIPIVKGDEKIALCAIASIIAKVTRDREMMRYSKKYPEYRFDLHKGYGTKLHFEMIKKHGLSPIHRVSFARSRING